MYGYVYKYTTNMQLHEPPQEEKAYYLKIQDSKIFTFFPIRYFYLCELEKNVFSKKRKNTYFDVDLFVM